MTLASKNSPQVFLVLLMAASVVGCWLMPTSGARAAEEPAATPDQTALVKPADWLKAQTGPNFAPGHTLAPLTRWGWAMSFDTAKELADRWGYAVEFSGYVTEAVADDALAKPDSRNGQVLALVAADPEKYKLGVLLHRAFPAEPPPEAYLRDAEGNFITDKNDRKQWSPEMPEAFVQGAAELSASGLRKLRQRVPVTIIQNGGEYGLNVLGFVQPFFEKDPSVVAAKGDLSWYNYLSRQKAREQKAVYDAVAAACPDRLLYVFYPCGGNTHRRGPSENYSYGWGWDYSYMRACADLATNEYYYHHFNSGWLGGDNMLTQCLAAKGYELKLGMKNTYDYVCAGWEQTDPPPVWDATQPLDNNAKAFGDLRLYEGFLKCLYTSGMIGGVAGYFSYPKGGFDAPFAPDKPPHFLMQMVVFSRVHALFSHQEAFLRAGELLPGPNKHVYIPDQFAYEFPTGNPNLRVLARALPDQPRWLITAWAADGVEGPATVEIPDLGSVTLQARAVGSVYTATREDGKPLLKQVDL